MNLDALKLIVVPTDFSEPSAIALRAAVRLAQVFGVPIEMLHVDINSSLVMPPPIDLLSVSFVFDRVAAGTAEQLERIVAEARQAGVVCTSASEVGRSYVAIVEHARRRGAGLIVIGSHGRHGLSHLLLGSVAEKVVEHAPCAVLVVPVTPDV